MRYISVCSGIEAATVAWEPLGFVPVAFAETAKFPSRVLAHRWPHVPNLGDLAAIDAGALGPVDLLVGGTPCQAFSVAGRRASLADRRGNLTLAFADLFHALVDQAGARWALWENVPGVLSLADNAFGCFLARLVGGDDALPLPRGVERWPDAGMVAGPRARAAWRILDAQYFGLAQRRRRVFVVVGAGERADPAAVLFERQGLRRHPPSRGEAGAGATCGTLSGTSDGGGWRIGADEAAAGHLAYQATGDGFWRAGVGPLSASDDNGTNQLVAFDTTQITSRENRCDPQPGDPCHPLAAGAHPPAIAFTCKDHGQDSGADISPTLRAMPGEHANAGERDRHLTGISSDCFDRTGEGAGETAGERSGLGIEVELGQTLKAKRPNAVATAMAVRRLLPTECERLQGFPNGHTAIPGAADGPRYMALGNSMAVPCMAWMGRRIAALEAPLFAEAAE